MTGISWIQECLFSKIFLRILGGVTECLFVLRINLPKVEEIREEQTGK